MSRGKLLSAVELAEIRAYATRHASLEISPVDRPTTSQRHTAALLRHIDALTSEAPPEDDGARLNLEGMAAQIEIAGRGCLISVSSIEVAVAAFDLLGDRGSVCVNPALRREQWSIQSAVSQALPTLCMVQKALWSPDPGPVVALETILERIAELRDAAGAPLTTDKPPTCQQVSSSERPTGEYLVGDLASRALDEIEGKPLVAAILILAVEEPNDVEQWRETRAAVVTASAVRPVDLDDDEGA